MRLKSILVLLLLVGLISCKSKSAFEYSESIVKIERSLSNDITEAEMKIGDHLRNEQYDSAASISKNMEDLVGTKLKEVEKLDVPKVKEADQFQKAAIRYFAYMKSIYTSYKNYALQTTDEGRESERQKLLAVVGEKEQVIDDMQRAQKKYAEANGFKIDQSK